MPWVKDRSSFPKVGLSQEASMGPAVNAQPCFNGLKVNKARDLPQSVASRPFK